MSTVLELQGPGLYPLTPQAQQALIDAVNQTLMAQHQNVAGIHIGTIQVCFSMQHH